MSGGQIAALTFAILLLLPGGCFVIFGSWIPNGAALIAIGIIILAVAALMFWFAFRQSTPPPPA